MIPLRSLGTYGRVLCCAVACVGGAVLAPAPVRCATELRLATTTSPADTGLLEVLDASFEKAHDAKVAVVAVGSGEAIALGKEGKADVVLVHAPEAEVLFVTEGFGMDRRAVMHNDFVLVGPPDDPVGIRGITNPAVALARIASARSPFVSRADASGTYLKEKALWWQGGIMPSGSWYFPEGGGMGATLTAADKLRGYTLTDRGTYVAYQERITLEILVEGGPALYNPYHVILVNPDRNPGVQTDLARAYADFLTGPEGQAIIGGFRVGGKPVFLPDALPAAAPPAGYATPSGAK